VVAESTGRLIGDGREAAVAPGPGGRDRFPRWVYGHGDEPDARFTLANERTFLAWIRTGLALLAGGVALEALDLPLQPGLRFAAAVLLLALGLLVPGLAWFGWGTTERALRRGDPLPASRIAPVLAVGATVVAALALLGVVLR
jgi:putative membrane protein